jgi:hypothetical protein
MIVMAYLLFRRGWWREAAFHMTAGFENARRGGYGGRANP